MSYRLIPDFVDYDTSHLDDDNDGDFYAVTCLTCGDRWGSHYGDDDERSTCGVYVDKKDMDEHTKFFVPNLKPLRPKFKLEDSLFEIN
jgi:hypothetical protein